jgi:Brp/Blh family beta-carotene 15,15'-monooxygenase
MEQNDLLHRFFKFISMQLKLRSYLLLIALLLYIIELLFNFNPSTQISFLIFVLILFGVPHGALDLYIDQHLNKKNVNQKLFLLKYVGNIMAYALVWYCFPIVALIIFILITSYHFGEIDWLGKTNTVLHKFIYTFLGFAWILFLLTKNIQFALDIFLTMGRSGFRKETLVQLAHAIYPFTLITLFAIYFFLFFFKDRFFNNSIHFYYSLVQTILLILFVLFMPLWISFAFYFGFWHSLLSFDKIRISFNIPNNLNGWSGLLIKSAPFSIMAWFGFAYITFLTLNSKDSAGIFTLLFISLSVLALPHLQVFTKLKIKS